MHDLARGELFVVLGLRPANSGFRVDPLIGCLFDQTDLQKSRMIGKHRYVVAFGLGSKVFGQFD